MKLPLRVCLLTLLCLAAGHAVAAEPEYETDSLLPQKIIANKATAK